MDRQRINLLGVALVLSQLSCDSPTAPTGPYRLEILPGFGNASSPYYNDSPYGSYAYAIDPAGRAVGMAERAEPREFYGAALWPVSGVPVSLEDPDGTVMQAAYGVNEQGQVVGVGTCRQGRGASACLWEAGRLTNLGSLDYDGENWPRAVNNRGDVVGWSQAMPLGFDHAVLWRNGAVIDLGTLGGLQSQALDIDELSRVVGWARPADGTRHAFLWDHRNGMLDLGSLGAEESVAHAINDSGQVVGWLGSTEYKRAFLWEDGTMHLLPGGTEFSEAFGVNNNGDIVGTYIVSGTTFRAALWRNGVRCNLDELVGDDRLNLTWATAINDAGEIVGVGRWKNQFREFGFRLRPNGR